MTNGDKYLLVILIILIIIILIIFLQIRYIIIYIFNIIIILNKEIQTRRRKIKKTINIQTVTADRVTEFY